MSLTDMIVKPTGGYDENGEFTSWNISRGSRRFIAIRTERGAWATYDLDREDATIVADVSGDLAGSLQYVESLFQ